MTLLVRIVSALLARAAARDTPPNEDGTDTNVAWRYSLCRLLVDHSPARSLATYSAFAKAARERRGTASRVDTWKM